MDTLSFSIHAELQIGSLLGGNINWPLGCVLTISGDYYLIQADLVRGEQGGPDVLQLLNTAFGCSLPEGYIKADNAGFFTFGKRRETGAGKTLKEIFPAYTLPEGIASTVVPMDNTTAFWLSVNLRAIDILDHLIEIGIPGQENQLALHALLNNTKNAADNLCEVMLSAVLPDITLLRLFTFSQLRFCLQLASEKRRAFQLEGKLSVNLFDAQYVFQGSVKSDGHQLCAEITSSHCLEKLFGGKMRGVVLARLTFCLIYVYKDAVEARNTDASLEPGESLIWLNGSVNYANLTLSGKLYLYNGSPVLAVVAIEQDFSVSKFFEQSLDISWPATLFELQLGSGSQIYYRAEKASLPACFSDDQYQKGFNILANVSLTLWKTLSFSLRLQVTKDAVVGSVALHTPIDLFIIQITGKGGTEGPEFGLAKKEQHLAMFFSGGVCFFGHYCGDIDVSCTRSRAGKLNVKGNITVNAKVFRNLIPRQVTLGFSYNRDDGFSVTGWPDFDFSHACIDFAKEIKKWANSARGDICSKIPGFINEKLLHTTFRLRPSFAQTSGGKMPCLCLNGYYALHMFDEEILKLDLPSVIQVELPENVSWEALPDIIGQALAGAASSLLEGIVNNSENLSKILLVLAGKEALEVAATLACRNLIDKVISNAISAAVSALIEEYGGQVTAAALGALFALIAMHTKDHPKPEPRPDPAAAPDKPEHLLAGVRVNADGQPEIVFSWSPVVLASQYHAMLYDADNRLLAESKTADTPCLAEFPRNNAVDTTEKYVLKVLAAGNGKFSPFAHCELNRLSPPAPEDAYLEVQGLRISWSSPAGRADEFQLKICSGTSEHTVSTAEPYYAFNPDLPEYGDTDYRFSVRALSSLPNLSSAFSREIHRTRIPACTLSDVSLQGEKVLVTWQAPAQASHSHLQLRARRGEKRWSARVTAPEQTYAFPLLMEEGSGFFFARISGRVADASGALPALWSGEWRVFRSLLDLAAIARSRRKSAVECGLFLLHDRPAAKLSALACCLAGAGYPVTETAPALRSVYAAATLTETARGLFRAGYSREDADGGLTVAWPQVSRAELSAVLDAVYGPALSLEQAAAQLFTQGIRGAECGKRLSAAYPLAGSVELASAMADAGYAAAETSAGLLSARPGLSVKDLAAALQAAYGAPDTPAVLAQRAFAQGLSGAECGKQLIAAHPLTGSVELANAMAGAGYQASETLAGLVSARPDLALKDLAAALRAAYSQ